MEDIIYTNQYLLFSSLSWANRGLNFTAFCAIEHGHFTNNGQWTLVSGDAYGRKWRTKEPLDESERGEWKSWLKAQHSEN